MVRIQLDNSLNGEPMHSVTVMKSSVQVDPTIDVGPTPYTSSVVSLPHQNGPREGPVWTSQDTQEMERFVVKAEKEIQMCLENITAFEERMTSLKKEEMDIAMALSCTEELHRTLSNKVKHVKAVLKLLENGGKPEPFTLPAEV